MDVDSVRDYCLSFPQAKETLQWGETLCFKAGGKIFAMLSLAAVPPSLCFKCAPERFVELCELEGIRPAPYVGRYKWVLLERLGVLGDEEIEDLIRQSHQMVAPTRKEKLTVKARVKKSTSRPNTSKHLSTSLRASAKHKGRRRKRS